jgi:hypothetical protein
MPGGVGGMPDYMTLPNGQRIPTIMTPFGSRILQAMQMRAEIGVKGSEARKNNADADYTSHRNAQPLPGDPNYVTTMQPIWGGEASARAQGELPAHLEEIGAQNQGRLAAARIGAGATLGAANIGAQSRTNVANIEQGGANTRQTNQQTFERGMVPLRTGATVNAEQQKTLFDNRFSVPGSLMRLLPWTPKEPTAPLPGTVDPAAQQRADWDAAAAHLGAGQDAASVLGPRP